MTVLLTEQEQHEALSHLKVCLDHDPHDMDSERPNWDAIAELLARFAPSEVWARAVV